MTSWFQNSILIIFLLISLVSCGSEDEMANLRGLYTDLAKEVDPDRNPVIVIPGILASTLVEPKSGIVAWGAIGRGLENPKKEEEIRRIALPMGEKKTFKELRDNLVAGSALEGIKVTLYGVTVEINTYSDIFWALGIGGSRSEDYKVSNTVDYGKRHYSAFQFAYDWCRDLVDAAPRDWFISSNQ